MLHTFPTIDGHELRPEADLSNLDLDHGAFHSCDLRSAVFVNSQLRGVHFNNVNLEGVNFINADLTRAVFIQCNLDGTNFYKSVLEDARFYGASMIGAENILCISPFGSRGDSLIVVRHEKKLMYKTGCFWGTSTQLLKASNNTHGIGNPYTIQYRAAIHFAQIIFKQQRILNNPPF